MTDAATPATQMRQYKETLVQNMARYVPEFGIEAKILLTIFAILAVWGLAIATFGFPALLWPMKLVVPVCFVMLIVITQGK